MNARYSFQPGERPRKREAWEGRGSKGRKVERANQKRAFEPLHLYPLASVTVVPTFLLFLLLSLARGSFGRIIIFLDRFLTVEKDVSFFFEKEKKERREPPSGLQLDTAQLIFRNCVSVYYFI